MAKEKRNINMPRPNIMWFWAAITLVIVGYWIFNNDDAAPVKSDWSTVEQMVKDGDVEKIVVVNRDEARVVLKEGKVEGYQQRDIRYKKIPKSGYQFFFNIGSVDSFKTDLEKTEDTDLYPSAGRTDAGCVQRGASAGKEAKSISGGPNESIKMSQLKRIN